MNRRNAAGGVVAFTATAVLALTMKEWSAVIRPFDGSTVSGTATAVPQTRDSLMVKIQIKGGTVGDTYAWHLHSGGCDSSGAVLGDAARYHAMQITPEQTGEATARVNAALRLGVPYSVNVHRSPSDMGVIACGNLRPIAGGYPGEGRR